MSGIEDIQQLLRPRPLEGLHKVAPVLCQVWQGGSRFESVTLPAYAFDTLDTLKQYIANKYKTQEKTVAARYLPKFLFVGIPMKAAATTTAAAAAATDSGVGVPSTATRYLPLDYNWFSPGSSNPTKPISLPSPLLSLTDPIPEFTTRSGAFPALTSNPRGRTILEDAFPTRTVPTLHVFPLHMLLAAWTGVKPISEADWNSHFAAYFPTISLTGPYTASEKDIKYGQTLYSLTEKRMKRLRLLDERLDSGEPLPDIIVTGVQQLRLLLQKVKGQFDGCESLFYKTAVTDNRPFLRLIPAATSAITKVLVKGVLPIPALEDPEVIVQWAKEGSPVVGSDILTVKYVHRPAIGTTCPIYGTIRILQDGTADLLLQPPERVKRLDPHGDFRNFGTILTEVLEGFPFSAAEFKLREAALQFQLIKDSAAAFLTKTNLRKRLGFFTMFFQEIAPPERATFGQAPIIALRYKAVSQYATEDRIMSYITQYVTSKSVQGQGIDPKLLENLQEEFDLSEREAEQQFTKWLKDRDTVTLAVPEAGEFMESYNPGIDILVYRQPPNYHIEVQRIDSYSSFQLIFTLLGILFSDEEDLFEVSEGAAATFVKQTADVEREELEEEGSGLGAAAKPTAFSRTAATAVGAATASAIGAKALGASMAAMEDLLEEEEEEEEGEEEGKTFTPAPAATAAIAAKAASATAAKAASATAAKAASVATVKGKPAKPDVDEERTINPTQWLLNKLQQVDPSLFAYTAVPAGADNYGRMCGTTEARQPSVLDKQRLDDMMEEYEPEVAAGKVFFSLYPLGPEDDEYDPPASAQEITITRYGSDPTAQNFYFCPLLFCLYDQKMVLEKDFAGTVWRPSAKKAGAKPPNTCPFCGGTEIAPNAKKPVPKATVYRRKKKSGGDKPHLHIGFMKKTTQPDGYALPCCFIPPKILSITDKQYERFRTEAREEDVKKVIPEEELEEEELEEGEVGEGDEAAATASVAESGMGASVLTASVTKALKASQRSAIPYGVIFEKIAHPTTYILLAEKHPIDVPGKFAILPAPFDKYFGQNSDTIVLHDTIRRQVKSQSKGFIRVGTEIGRLESTCGTGAEPTEALFGVLAPLLLQHSIEEVRARILEKVESVPQLFVSANFGNLVNEFYNPADPMELLSKDVRNMTDQTDSAAAVTHLKAWAAANLQIAIDDNLFAIRRIYNAYYRFKRFLKDKTQRKEVRHFSSFLAEPGILTHNGLQLIVLEWDVPKASEEPKDVTVRCMPYGFSADRQARSDFAFVWKDKHGYYELMVYTHNEPKRGATVAKNDHEIRFAFENRASWPPIVKQRIDEFTTQCVSNYRTVYTPQRGVNSLAMIPLSAAVTKVKSKPAGIVRDAYNHATMLLFPMKPGRLVAASLLVALPIVDDGWMPTKLHLYLDIENFRPAPADLLINYYKANFEDLFSLYEGYVIENVVRLRSSRVICAVQLKNGLYVPASPPADGKALTAMGYKLVEIEKMEWTINTELTKPCGSESELHNNQTTQKLEELYQQYRYIFSNWLASSAAGEGVRTTLQEVIFGKYPDYEKRKRLEIFLGSTLRSWLVPDEEKWDMPQTFLRKDCRVMDEAGCTGSCTWKASTGQCGLHVDAKAILGMDNKEPREVSTPELFSRRLIDELIRFPNRRKELRTRGVSRLRPITSPLREGDQYIIPESSTTWINLLRMDWVQDGKEVPKFYEEMASYVQPKTMATALPALDAVLGPNTYRLWNAKNLGDLLRIMGVKAEELGLEGATDLTPESIGRYVKAMNLSVGTVDLRGEPSIAFVRSDKGSQDRALLVVKQPEGLGLLLEEAGRAYVEVAKFPEALRAKWDVVAVKPRGAILKRKAVSSLLKPAASVTAASTDATAEAASIKPESSQVALSRVGDLFAPPEDLSVASAAPKSTTVATAATATATTAAKALPSAQLIRKALEKKPAILSPVAEESSINTLSVLPPPAAAAAAAPSVIALPPPPEPAVSASKLAAAAVAPTPTSKSPPKALSIAAPPPKAASATVTPKAPSVAASIAAPPPKAPSIAAAPPPPNPAPAAASKAPSIAAAPPPPKPASTAASKAPSIAAAPPPPKPASTASPALKPASPALKPASAAAGKKSINLSAFDLSEEEGEESNESPLAFGANNEEEEAPVSKKAVSKKPAAAPAAAPAASKKPAAAASKKPAPKKNKNNNNNSPNYLRALEND